MSTTAAVYCSGWWKHVAVITEAQTLEVTKYIGLVWLHVILCQLSITSCFEAKRIFLIAKHSSVLCGFLYSVKKSFTWFRHMTDQFDLSCCKTLSTNLVKDGRSLVYLTNDQAASIFSIWLKTDQGRETFRPSCRGNLLIERRPFSTFEARLKGSHAVKRVILQFVCYASKIVERIWKDFSVYLHLK